MNPSRKSDVFAELQASILQLQGLRFSNNTFWDDGFGDIKNHFPNSSFPTGAVHEFVSSKKEDVASTGGFLTSILSFLMGDSGAALWISSSRTVFAPALKSFGVNPDRFIFVDVKKEKEVIWGMEEALKCGALASVVGEIRDLDFVASRRLQLAVEQSQVTEPV